MYLALHIAYPLKINISKKNLFPNTFLQGKTTIWVLCENKSNLSLIIKAGCIYNITMKEIHTFYMHDSMPCNLSLNHKRARLGHALTNSLLTALGWAPNLECQIVNNQSAEFSNKLFCHYMGLRTLVYLFYWFVKEGF